MSFKKTRNKLFSDFPNVTASQWKSQVEKDLKGIPFDRLIWKTPEGFNVQPFYLEEDPGENFYLHAHPGEFPYVRSNKWKSNDWIIRQDFLVENVEEANAKATDALDRGASAIGFIMHESLNPDPEKFRLLLKDIYLGETGINFCGHIDPLKTIELLDKEIRDNRIDPTLLNGSVDLDPVGHLSKSGHLNLPEKDAFSLCADTIRKSSVQLPNLRVIGINPHIFHHAGSTIVQDLAFGLAIISEYMDQLTSLGLTPGKIARAFQLNFATGSSFFMEIARLRAARLLFSQLIKSWGVTDIHLLKTFIHCSTSEWSQAVYDPYMNMLRSTTQAMSAVIGGADSVTVIPYDQAFQKSSVFSERIARNTQVILKEEAFFEKVIDPSAGSCYVETLTKSLVKHAWDLFLQVEDQGGYLKAFKDGFIQKSIHEAAKNRDKDLAFSRKILVGINKYINPADKSPVTEMNEQSPASGTAGELAIAEPLVRYRGAGIYEEIRGRTENSKRSIPKVFLLTFGKPGPRRARAEFASNFFACAGFEIIDHHGFETIMAGIETAHVAEPDIVVFCSSDEEYLQIPQGLKNILNENVVPVLAGYPQEMIEEIRSKGINHFIHIRSNVPEELSKFQELLGI